MKDMIRKRVKKSVITTMIAMLAALALLAGIFALNGEDSFRYLTAPRYEEMSISEKDAKVTEESYIESKDLVRADIYFVTDCFASDDSGSYYLVPYADENYIIVYVNEEYIPVFEEALENTWAFANEEIEEYPKWDGFTARGALYELDDYTLDYLLSWLDGYEENYFPAGTTADKYASYIEPYIFCYTGADGWTDSINIFICIGVIWVIALITAIIVNLIAPNAQLSAAIKKTGSTADEIDNEYESGEKAGDTSFGSQHIFFRKKNKPFIIDRNSVIWAYQSIHTTVHKTYGVETGRTVDYSVNMADANGNIYTASCDSDKETKEILGYFERMMPDVLLGYSDDLYKLYKKNREEFIRSVRERNFTRV